MTERIMLSKDFSQQELQCKCCGKCVMHPDMIAVLQEIRNIYGKAIYIHSGYRCPQHPVEQMKDRPGEHTYGMAVDIVCHGLQALQLLSIALGLGVTRIGLNQKGRANNRFMHIGISDKLINDFPSNAIWTY